MLYNWLTVLPCSTMWLVRSAVCYASLTRSVRRLRSTMNSLRRLINTRHSGACRISTCNSSSLCFVSRHCCFADYFIGCNILLINNNNNERFILRRKMPKQTQRRRSLHIGKTHGQHLEVCCRGLSSC